ncbi:MAG: flavodoxin family protein [Campylobacteraceae bacterium]|nr:flavodoxin family protein [Campylobacteraceae bacterium]
MIVKFIDCTETYHQDMNKIIEFFSNYLKSKSIKTYKLKLSEMKIVRCTQCRCCTLKKADSPVKCVIKDDMNKTIDEIEEADAYIILADRNNLFSKNKIHEKFSERLVAYYYWPFSQTNSTPRRISLQKKSILINYNTTKYFLNHSFYTAKKYMEHASTSIGAKVLDWEAITPKDNLIKSYSSRLKNMADNLINSLKD